MTVMIDMTDPVIPATASIAGKDMHHSYLPDLGLQGAGHDLA
jgi:hypothetical protein